MRIEVTEAVWIEETEYHVVARIASRLEEDLELDAHAVAVALALIERIRRLEAEVRALKAGAPSP
jgi:hypothetical protein